MRSDNQTTAVPPVLAQEPAVARMAYVRKRQSMETVRMLPIHWLSNNMVMRSAMQSVCLSGALDFSQHYAIGAAPSAKEQEPPTVEPHTSLLTKRLASVMTQMDTPDASHSAQEKKTRDVVSNKQTIAADIDSRLQWLDELEESVQHQALDYAVQQWRMSRPDVVLLSPQQSSHRCEDRLKLAVYHRTGSEDSVLRKNAPRKPHAWSAGGAAHGHRAIVPYAHHNRPMPCQMTRLTTIVYRNGHRCVIDNDQHARLCPYANDKDMHRPSLELWRDDTLYMCNTSAWAHRCGSHCQVSIQVSDTQYCYTCPITGLADTSRCLPVTSFWTPENEMQGANELSSNGGTCNSSSGSSGSGGSGGAILTSEDLRLRQMFTRDGSLRRHGETLMHQLNHHEVCHDWVHQLVARRTRAEIHSFSFDYIRATMRCNRPLGYLITAMCDLWMLLCPERRALELQRMYRVHALASDRARRNFLAERQRRHAHNAHDALGNTPPQLPTLPPMSLLDMDSSYYAHVATYTFPILPAINECATFIVAQAHALVQLWYVLHTRVLKRRTLSAPKAPPVDEWRNEVDAHRNVSITTHPPPEGAIAFAKFTIPALHLLSRGVKRPALHNGELDQVLVAPQHALLMILPNSSVLNELCGTPGDPQYRALSLAMEGAMIEAVQHKRCTVEQLDFTRVPFERMDPAHFFSLDLRER